MYGCMSEDGEGKMDNTDEKEVERGSDNNRRRQPVLPIYKSRAQCPHASSPTGLCASSRPDWVHPTTMEIVSRANERSLVLGTYLNFNVEGRIAQFTVHRVVRPVHDHIRHICAAREEGGDRNTSRHVDVLEV